MANPASVFCEEKGGRIDIRTQESGDQTGYCVFQDGSECDEWAYFRGECKPASEAGDQSTAPMESGWKVYQNAEAGYSFNYPAEATITPNDDPLQGISMTGPVASGESWPLISINHPADREAYRPPEGADLAQWLADHNMLGEQRLDDTQVAGTSALHFRHERSPQSSADDRYYFARAGQLYEIVIVHTGDKEDWDLYNRFLESFQFAG
jgi:hypothetical protein